MRKIAIALSKGGVGKTTTAVNLAYGLSREGKHVLLIDADTQGHISASLGVAVEDGLTEVLIDDVLTDEVVTEARNNLWVLAAGRNLAGAKRVIAQKEYGAEHTLSEVLANVDYDYVLLDCAPGWDVLSVNALFFADEILSPVSLEALSLRGLGDFVKQVKQLKKYHSGLRMSYVLPTFLDGRVKKSQEILDQLDSYFGSVMCNPIRYNVSVSEAAGHGKTIFEYAPKSPGSQDYAELVRKVVNDER